LIEQANWKGKRVGNVGMHAQQALVLVNYNHATQYEVLAFAAQVKASVLEKFDVSLEIEPVVIKSVIER
jgi:UDP-N-acetylmuramate dehydrogenase